LGPNHKAILTSIRDLVNALENKGGLREAEKLRKQTLVDYRENVLRASHPDTLITAGNQGCLCWSRGKEAEKMYRDTLRDRESTYSRGPGTLWTQNGTGGLLFNTGRVEEAEQMHRRYMEGYITALGPHHIDTLWMINEFAACCLRAGEHEKAEDGFQRVYSDKL
ncbi:hypothetical protein K469DRAFT_576148, partial [Zopfia rhizophila CBS 207.26]